MTNEKIYFENDLNDINQKVNDVLELSGKINAIYEELKDKYTNVIDDREGEPETSERGLALDELSAKLDNVLNVVRNFHSASIVAEKELEKIELSAIKISL